MKPDQHKIKKNQAYKKKHGISNDKLQTNNGLSSKNGLKSESRVEPNPLKEAGGSRSACLSKKEPSHRVSAVDELTNTLSEDEIKKSSFTRRKIESNWQKYEIDIDDDEEAVREADYNEILQSARNVQPQFQFGRHHSVEEESVTSESNADWLEKYVSLDCDHLAAAFRCIPLHNRLDIEESFFEEASLEAYRRDAADQLTAYRQTIASNGTSTTSNQHVAKTLDEAFHSAGNVVNYNSTVTDDDCVKRDSVTDAVLINDRSLVDEFATADTSEIDFVRDNFEASQILNNDEDGNGALEVRKGSENIAPDEKCNEFEATDIQNRRTTAADVKISSTADAAIPAIKSCTAGQVVTNVSSSLNHKSIAELEDELDSLLAL